MDSEIRANNCQPAAATRPNSAPQAARLWAQPLAAASARRPARSSAPIRGPFLRLPGLSQAILQNRKAEAGSIARVPAPENWLTRTPYRSNDAEFLRAMAIDSLGLVQLPTFIVGPDVAAERLTPVLAKYRPIERWGHAVYPSGRQLLATVRVFSDFFARFFRTPPWRTG